LQTGRYIKKKKTEPEAQSLVSLYMLTYYSATATVVATTVSVAALSATTRVSTSAATSIVSVATVSVAAASSLELLQEKRDALNTTASIKTNFFIFFLRLNNKTIFFSFKNDTKVIQKLNTPNKNYDFFQRNFAFGKKIKKYVFSIHPILTNFFRVLSYNQLIIRMLPREDVTHGPD
jgi:hypothetical protein